VVCRGERGGTGACGERGGAGARGERERIGGAGERGQAAARGCGVTWSEVTAWHRGVDKRRFGAERGERAREAAQ
jgi:hypothetical protein